MDVLAQAALDAQQRAYVPYSKFAVGAALRTKAGQMFAGCNVENAAYPEGTCAEAGAIAAMVMGLGRGIEEIVIVGAGPGVCSPCGGCRQKLREFGDGNTIVRVLDTTGRLRLTTTLEALLPHSFGPQNVMPL